MGREQRIAFTYPAILTGSELIFVYGIKIQLYPFLWTYLVFLSPIVEKTVLSPLHSLKSLDKDNLTICTRGCFWALYFGSFVYMCVFLCQYHSVLITLTFQYVLKPENIKPLNLFSSFKIILAVWNPLIVHMNLRIFFLKKMPLGF